MLRKSARTFIALALGATIALPLLPSAQAADTQTRGVNWRADKDALPGTVVYSAKTVGAAEQFTGCVMGFSDPACDPKSSTLLVNNYLPLCESEKTLDCIDAVTWKKSDGTLVTGKYSKIRGSEWADYAFARNEALHVNKPTLPQVFTFDGLTHSKGTEFAVTAHISTRITAGVAADPDISLVILPVYQVAGLDPADDAECITANGADVDSVCYKIGDLAEAARFKLSLKLLARPQGWMTGRVVDPSITFTAPTDTEKRTVVTLEGTSIDVQTIDRTYSSAKPTDKAKWDTVATAFGDSRAPWSTAGDATYPLPPDKTSISIFNSIVSAEKDASASTTPTFDIADSLKSLWRVDLQPKGRAEGVSCDSSNFQGFVSSNAMVYKSALPNYDKTTGTLDYSISSPHYKPDGKTEFLGRYDLLVATDYARCVWDLKAGEIPAKDAVTVTIEKAGEKKVISAEMSLDDQYFKFTAQGFTFSQAKLSIKLKAKESITAPAPAPAPATPAATPAKPAAAKTITITCVKGKTTKKVTAAKPVCPAGFKKK